MLKVASNYSSIPSNQLLFKYDGNLPKTIKKFQSSIKKFLITGLIDPFPYLKTANSWIMLQF